MNAVYRLQGRWTPKLTTPSTSHQLLPTIPPTVSPFSNAGTSMWFRPSNTKGPTTSSSWVPAAGIVAGVVVSCTVPRDKVRALTSMPDPTNTKFETTCSLLGGLSYYHKFLKNPATKVRPLNAPIKQGAKFDYTADMADFVKALLRELFSTPCLGFSGLGRSNIYTSRRLRLCSESCIDGFGAFLEQETGTRALRWLCSAYCLHQPSHHSG